MGYAESAIAEALRKDIDQTANVVPFRANLSAYLSSAYSLYRVDLLGEKLILAEPAEQHFDSKKTLKGATALSKALLENVVLCLPALSRPQRRALVEARQAFITNEGDYYLPQLALSFSENASAALEQRRTFNPTQQLVFLYCLYAKADLIVQSDIQKALGLSAGSVSSALSLLVKHRLIDYSTGGKTARKKSYYVRDKAKYYRDGIQLFGKPVKELIEVPLSSANKTWPKSGLSALAEQSDLLPPDKTVFAVSSSQAKRIMHKGTESLEYCRIQVLKYDPAILASNGCVDPLTMLLTIDDNDERISIALKQALGGYEWYQA